MGHVCSTMISTALGLLVAAACSSAGAGRTAVPLDPAGAHPRSATVSAGDPAAGDAVPRVPGHPVASRSQAVWYRGNTHAHTNLSHADSAPEDVARWYHDHGYNFLVLSEHQVFIDPATVKMPVPLRSDFILVGGCELSRIPVHATGVNMKSGVVPTEKKPTNQEMLREHLERIRSVGGLTIVNHPNASSVTAEDILAVEGLHLLEVFNAAPATHSLGGNGKPSVEAMWDDILTAGRVMWGVASDDAHHFAIWDYKGETAPPRGRVNNPGRGWVMVQADALTPDAIAGAMKAGRFYFSNSVFLKGVDESDGHLTIEVDQDRTASELQRSTIMGFPTSRADHGYEVLFIGLGGTVLQRSRGTKASIALTKAHAYVRGKVIYRTERYGRNVELYAWTQPVFTDGRQLP